MALWVQGAGGKVRDHVGQGYGKISQCFCTSVFCNAETPCPRASLRSRVRMRSSRVRMRAVHVFSLSRTDLSRVTGGTLPLAEHHKSSSQPKPQAPIMPPTGPVERTLFLGPNVGTLVTLLLVWGFGVTTGKCFRPTRTTRQGGR